MAKMPKQVHSILSMVDSGDVVEDLRPYLGMSILGHPCPRYLWYTFHWCYKDTFSKRVRRLFDRGNREEPAVIKELEKIGIKVSGMQENFETSWGHIRGHCDGVCENVPEAPKTPHILEVKTASDKSFKDMMKLHLKEANPQYFAQCQLYMYFGKFTRALFIMVNKNDDSWYVERVKLDKDTAEYLIRIGNKVLLSPTPPDKRYGPTYFKCKWCSAYDICHGDKQIEDKNCRTCRKCAPTTDGDWFCDEHDKSLSVEEQRAGCDEHEWIEEL